MVTKEITCALIKRLSPTLLNILGIRMGFNLDRASDELGHDEKPTATEFHIAYSNEDTCAERTG